MRLIKFSSIFAVLGFIFLALSFVAAKGLDQSKTYKFPESVVRHYAQVSGKVFEGGSFGSNAATIFKKSIPVDDAANAFDTLDIETVAVNVEISQSPKDGEIEIELMTNKVDPKEPVLIDTSRGKTVRIMTQEASKDQVGRHGWMVFNFDDDSGAELKHNVLQVRVPKSLTIGKVHTVSGDLKLAAALSQLHFQSTSGDFGILTKENPLARVANLTIETISGAVKGPGRFDHLRVNTVSGNTELSSLDRVLDIDAVTVSGNVRIQATEPIDADVDFQTKSGDLKIAKELRSGVSGKSEPRKNSNFRLGKGNAKIKVQSVSGNLVIRATNAKAAKDIDPASDDDDSKNDDSDNDDDEASTWAPGKNPSGQIVAEEFLQCAARIAAREQTRIGASAARRCFRLIVNKSRNETPKEAPNGIVRAAFEAC